MAPFNPEDFRDALRRLYDRQLKHDEQIAKNDEQLAKLSQQLLELGVYVRETSEQVRLTNQQMQQTDARLDQLVHVVRSHEQRLQRIEGNA